MIIEQIYTGCLSQAAYYVESDGHALIIDPLRDIKQYIERAAQSDSKIEYILETHFHADFVSGHLALAKETGAKIIFGPHAQTDFDFHQAYDSEEINLGKVTIKAIHTPGHTIESTTYLLIDENSKNHALFTGDTLFLGDVGRPDLAVKSELSEENLAKHLYHSLYQKIMPLEDELIIYPGHGAGSACGKKMSKETIGTLGDQKQTNYALQNLSETEFVKQVTAGLVRPPQYFPKNVLLNKSGIKSVQEVLCHGDIAIETKEFELLATSSGALVLDTRDGVEYAAGHVPRSINIGLTGQFASWVGTLVEDLKQPILLVCDLGQEEAAISRLARVGYDNTIGCLKGGFESWSQSGFESDKLDQMSAGEVEELVNQNKEITVLDVRNKNEYLSQHLELVNLQHIPLEQLNQRMKEVQDQEKVYVHCAGGYRSPIAMSLLKARGIHNIVDIKGGFAALNETTLNTSKYVCPSSLL